MFGRLLRLLSVGVVLSIATVAVTTCTSGSGPPTGSSSATSPTGAGSALPANPYLGPAATSTMHADSGSSDTTPLPGPGAGPVDAASIEVGAVCTAVLVGSDGVPLALCTRISDLRPIVHLLDPASGVPSTSIEIAAGSLLGGVYGYLDHNDRMVLVDGERELLRIGHRRTDVGWELHVDERTTLGGSIPPGDTVTSVSPDYGGDVWFATGGGTVGLVDTATGSVRTLALPTGERVSNSISTAPAGMAVATTHAVYLVARDEDGEPEVRWRLSYDRGPARKPGQLSWGTGSTPTFFGPTDGADFVAVVDNADPEVHLVVVRTAGPDAGRQVCGPEVLLAGGPGSEDSPIGVGRSIVVTSTYGYPYPRLPDDAGPSVPASAPFEGGMTRVDVREDGSGCDVVWDTATRSAAVPRWSTADGTITTMTRATSLGGEGPGDASSDVAAYAVIDAATGAVRTEQPLGASVADPLQLAGTIAPGRVLYQGTVGAVLRITSAE